MGIMFFEPKKEYEVLDDVFKDIERQSIIYKKKRIKYINEDKGTNLTWSKSKHNIRLNLNIIVMDVTMYKRLWNLWEDSINQINASYDFNPIDPLKKMIYHGALIVCEGDIR